VALSSHLLPIARVGCLAPCDCKAKHTRQGPSGKSSTSCIVSRGRGPIVPFHGHVLKEAQKDGTQR
jgi:hypothetical protein